MFVCLALSARACLPGMRFRFKGADDDAGGVDDHAKNE